MGLRLYVIIPIKLGSIENKVLFGWKLFPLEIQIPRKYIMGVVFGWREMREAWEIQIPREIEFPMKHGKSLT